VAWAERTYRLAGRADDAIARLYSAIEKTAKTALIAHSIDNSKMPADQIPASMKTALGIAQDEQASIPLGLDASYQLLKHLEDPVGTRYAQKADELAKLLEIRNNSLMVHGWKTIKPETFDRMLELTLQFLDINAQDLPELPSFPMR